MRPHQKLELPALPAPDSSAALAARPGNLAGILHGRPVTENTIGKTCHGRHTRVEQALDRRTSTMPVAGVRGAASFAGVRSMRAIECRAIDGVPR